MILAWLFLLLQLHLLQNVSAEHSCPSDILYDLLPYRCECEMLAANTTSDRRPALNISCDEIPLDTVIPYLENYSVQNLYLRRCSATTLDEQFPQLKELRELSLRSCGIETIHPEAFSSFSSTLEKLDLYDNKITTLPTFSQEMQALTEIGL
ncbi:hypothetical protein PFISCL1PPCAC_987, partial [Pristionchus fissidentatus]